MADRVSRRTILRRTALTLGAAASSQSLWGRCGFAASPTRRVLVWSEGTAPKRVYPHDIRGAVAEGLKELEGWEVRTATLTDRDHGVSDSVLAQTDVLIWWGHILHPLVRNDRVDRIVQRVKEGKLGFIALHSSHFSKALRKLLGTECSFAAYVCDGSGLKVTVKDPGHPIAEGIRDFSLEKTERYTEPFQVPPPESVVFDGLYLRPDGSTETSRQGLTWSVGAGRVFYFQPGHETYPHFFDPNVRHILRNAVRWTAPKA
jgi:trehalose utilization protein